MTLRQARRVKDISQDTMCQSLGITRKTYIKWERNTDLIRIGTAKKIAALLGCSLNDIFLPSDITEGDVKSDDTLD